MRGFTHLFNAMSQLAAREPGVVGQAADLVIMDADHRVKSTLVAGQN